LFSKQIDSVVKYTLIVFKDKLHYFFTVWVTRNYENEKKTHFEYGLLHIYTHHYTKFLIFKNELQYFFLQYGLLEIIKMKKNTIFFT
jgi:hypothetical protein